MRDSGKYAIHANEKQNIDIISPKNFTVQLSILPPYRMEQNLMTATMSKPMIAKKWGFIETKG